MIPSQSVGTRPTSSYAAGDPAEQGASDQDHRRGEGRSQEDDPESVQTGGRGRRRRREREQSPRRDVVDRRARHRQRPHRAFEHPALGEDAGEHREGGDRHRDRHEQGERHVAHVRCEDPVERQGGDEAERHREGDARVRDERGLPVSLAQDPWIELHPDQEQVEGEPDRGRRAQQRHDVRREQIVLRCRPDRAEQGRAEQDAGEDLAHHPRLAEHGRSRPRRDGRRG